MYVEYVNVYIHIYIDVQHSTYIYIYKSNMWGLIIYIHIIVGNFGGLILVSSCGGVLLFV